MENTAYYDSPIGLLYISENGNSITSIQFVVNSFEKKREVQLSPLLKETIRQLSEYFDGIRQSFDLPLAPEGTDFQQKVWKALQKIHYGETCTYKQIAEAIDCPKGCRAVGLANNRNPIPIIIPCHRVIGANGKLVGYAGGLDIKTQLLTIESFIRMRN